METICNASNESIVNGHVDSDVTYHIEDVFSNKRSEQDKKVTMQTVNRGFT